MNKRAKVWWGAILAVGVLALYAAGSATWTELRRPGLDENNVKLLRQLAVADAPQLADLLDRSVVYIAAGDFVMGSETGRDDERPQHLVYLDAFEIDRYEVSNAQYQRFLRATERTAPLYWNGDEYPPGQADYPVVGVSWDDADAYCAWAGKRLPTEAEWEKACRGIEGRIYPWGDTWEPQRANVDVSARSPATSPTSSRPANRDTAWPFLQVTPAGPEQPGLRPVGSYLEGASPYGVMDLAGNASEWVADWYNWAGYADMPRRNPKGLEPPWNHSVRGSAWVDLYGTVPSAAPGTGDWVQSLSRCPARSSAHIAHDPRIGFRCARSTG